MGGRFGCCLKPKPTTAVDSPSKGLEIPSGSKSCWSRSTSDMDNRAVSSPGSISSVSTSNQTTDHPGTPSEFVNPGLILWNQTRKRWRGNKRSENQMHRVQPNLNWNFTYDDVLGSDKPFLQPIPLPEMVDFLVATWE